MHRPVIELRGNQRNPLVVFLPLVDERAHHADTILELRIVRIHEGGRKIITGIDVELIGNLQAGIAPFDAGILLELADELDDRSGRIGIVRKR